MSLYHVVKVMEQTDCNECDEYGRRNRVVVVPVGSTCSSQQSQRHWEVYVAIGPRSDVAVPPTPEVRRTSRKERISIALVELKSHKSKQRYLNASESRMLTVGPKQQGEPICWKHWYGQELRYFRTSH